MINQNSLEIGRLKEADGLVSCFYSALKSGENNLRSAPGLLLRLIDENMWQRRMMKTGQVVEFTRFVDFVTSKPLEGLGEDLESIKRICRDDPAALNAIDKVTVGEAGAPKGNDNAKTNRSISTVCQKEPLRGTTSQYALRKLRKDAPELHQQVLDGKLSPHKAMIEAGFRKQTFSVTKDINSAARFLAENFNLSQLDEIIRLAYMIKEKPELVKNDQRRPSKTKQ